MAMRKHPSPADIALMKARGYDPSTIAEAEQQLERWAKVEQLCRVIQDAFAGVTLGGGIGLQEAQGLDDYESAATCASCRVTDEKTDWRRISVEALNRCSSSLSFFDAEGMRFHLPAYLIADLQGAYDYDLSYCLTYRHSYANGIFTLFTDAQRRAVRAFLLHIADEVDYQFDRPEIFRALDEYWIDPI